jgi:hypothetical protein
MLRKACFIFATTGLLPILAPGRSGASATVQVTESPVEASAQVTEDLLSFSFHDELEGRWHLDVLIHPLVESKAGKVGLVQILGADIESDTGMMKTTYQERFGIDLSVPQFDRQPIELGDWVVTVGPQEGETWSSVVERQNLFFELHPKK